MNPSNPNSGILHSLLLKKVIFLTLLVSITYIGTTFLSEYHKITLGRTCKDRMKAIQEAKMKFRERYPKSTLTKYYELLPFLKFTGFPMCPWGGTYTQELSLTLPVQCSCNGDPTKEPDTPLTELKKNGFCDLEPEGETKTIVTKIIKYLKELAATPSKKEKNILKTKP